MRWFDQSLVSHHAPQRRGKPKGWGDSRVMEPAKAGLLLLFCEITGLVGNLSDCINACHPSNGHPAPAPISTRPPRSNFVNHQPLRSQTFSTSFESSSTSLSFHILQSQCLPRRIPRPPRQRSPPPLPPMAPTKVCFCSNSPLHCVAALRQCFRLGRTRLLMFACRYGQRGYPQRKHLQPGAIRCCWVVL